MVRVAVRDELRSDVPRAHVQRLEPLVQPPAVSAAEGADDYDVPIPAGDRSSGGRQKKEDNTEKDKDMVRSITDGVSR